MGFGSSIGKSFRRATGRISKETGRVGRSTEGFFETVGSDTNKFFDRKFAATAIDTLTGWFGPMMLLGAPSLGGAITGKGEHSEFTGASRSWRSKAREAFERLQPKYPNSLGLKEAILDEVGPPDFSADRKTRSLRKRQRRSLRVDLSSSSTRTPGLSLNQ